MLAASGLLVVFIVPSWAGDPVDRQVAVTVDDLPAASPLLSTAEISELTKKLLAALREQGVPAVGFVNEKRLYKFGEVDQRIQALAMWLDSGFELGNHTFSHFSLNKVGLKAWEDDTVQGEPVIKMLLSQHELKLRYFRHPFLDTGKDLDSRHAAEAFLAERGYTVAPVTLDAWDWMFAGVYEQAKRQGDTALQSRLVEAYLSYTDAVLAYSEQLSREVAGHEPKQVLLIHANQLEAEHFAELAAVFRKRGYRFISLENALSDPAYKLPDTYVGEEGAGWLEHWAITAGKPLTGAPVFPQWVLDRAKDIPRTPRQ
jgi:peptidoglycan/xylan/chitin deacetylase (PgdA/CDA1 family)